MPCISISRLRPLVTVLLLATAPACQRDADRGVRTDPQMMVSDSGLRDTLGTLVLADSLVIKDSSEVFHAYGYFIPDDTIRIGDVVLTAISLATVNYYYDGQLHYERPQVYVPPRAILAFSRLDEDFARARCVRVTVAPDTLALTCLGTVIGDVVIEGHFSYPGEPDPAQQRNIEGATLSARIAIRRSGAVLLDRALTFSYELGD